MDAEVIAIYENPPSREALASWSEHLDGGVEGFVSKRGRAYRELALKDRELTDAEWLDLIQEHPRLLRRPILTNGQQTVVGFSEKRYRDMLD